MQSYEKVGIEVEPGRAEHTAHCFVMSRTIKGISVQSSRKLLENEATSQPEFFPTMEIHLLNSSLSLPPSGARRAIAEESKERIHTRNSPRTSHPIIPEFPQKKCARHNANLVSARVPDTLEVAVPLGEAVHAVVALAHCAHEAAKRVDLVLAGVAAVLVDLGDADLDGAVVLGLDDAVGRAALAGDVPAQRENNGLVTGYVLSFLDPSSTRVGWAGAGAGAWKEGSRGSRCGFFGGSLTGRQARRGRSPF